MKSLEQLHEICERMRKVVQLREENVKEILEKAAMCESGKDADGNTYRTHVLVCGGTGCTSSGSARIRERLEKEIEANGLSDEVCVVKTGCFGLCALGPIMIVYPEGTFYSMVQEEDIPEIVTEHLLKGNGICRIHGGGFAGTALAFVPNDRFERFKEGVEQVLGEKICKNLFLCNRQKTQFYLLMLEGEKVFKTKDLSKQLGVARLSFADPADMEKYLDITPGSVSVLGLMNDTENAVQLVLDKPIAESTRIGCHPCINTSTLAVSTQDILTKFLPAVHHEPIIVDLPDPEDAD